MKIKVCGMREPENIREVAALKPDYLGFIFYERSPRYAGNLDPDIWHELPASIRKVGVFVNDKPETVLTTVRRYGLDIVQLHGDESPEICRRIRETCLVVKAVGIAAQEDLQRAVENYDGVCDWFLFDTRTPLYGGSGKPFDWEILNAYPGITPFFLSGGIGPEDAERIARLNLPALYAIDLNSRFETAPGVKDAASLKTFIDNIKCKRI